MSARAWVAAQLRASRGASLDAALLTERGGRYAASRVSLLGVRSLLRMGLHTVELLVLTRDMPFQFLAPLFAMRALPGLTAGLHWGALETLRAHVRRDVFRRQPERACNQVETWLAVTGLACMLLFTSITWLISLQPEEEAGPLGLYGAFAIVSTWTTAADLWTRTYHAGVFALGRVYRPSWTLFAVELLELGTLLAIHPRLGPFALHAAILVGSCVRAGLTFRYARRAYRVRQLIVPRLFDWGALKRAQWSDLWSSARHVVATLPQQLDRLLLIALLHAPTATANALPLAAPYYALRPLASFAQGWARGFYPDLVRLDVAALGVLRLRFERLLRRTALVAGLSSSAALCVAAYVLFGGQGVQAALWLLPLSVVRAQLALEQVRGFAYGAFPGLMRMGGVLAFGLLCAWYTQLTDRLLLALVVLLLVAARLVAGPLSSRANERRFERAQQLPLSAWIASLSCQEKPVRLAIALVDRQLTSSRAVLRALGPALGSGQAARIGHSWLAWWEPAEAAKSRLELARLCAGALRRLELVTAPDGARALTEACRQNLLPAALSAALAQPTPLRAQDALRTAACALVPDVQVIDLTRASGTLASLSPRELAVTRRAITAAAREQYELPRRTPWQVAAYAPSGELELVFLWPRSHARGGELVKLVRSASWRDSRIR